MSEPLADSEQKQEITLGALPFPLMPISASPYFTNGVAEQTWDASTCADQIDNIQALKGFGADEGNGFFSVSSERYDLPGGMKGLELAMRVYDYQHGPPCFSDKYHASSGADRQAIRSLQNALAGHRAELQSYMEDWSKRQNHILDTVMLNQEPATLPRDDPLNVYKHVHLDVQDTHGSITEAGTLKAAGGYAQKSLKGSYTQSPTFKQPPQTHVIGSSGPEVEKAGTTNHACASSEVANLASHAPRTNVIQACASSEVAKAATASHALASAEIVQVTTFNPAASEKGGFSSSFWKTFSRRKSHHHGHGTASSPFWRRKSKHEKHEKRKSRMSRFAMATRVGHAVKAGVLENFMQIEDSKKHRRCCGRRVTCGRLHKTYDWATKKYQKGQEFIEEPAKQNILARCVLNSWFEGLCATIIMANSICLGYSSDYAIRNLEAPTTEALDNLELAFTIFYTVELLLRMVVLGTYFFITDDWKWNTFDLVLVASSIWDVITTRLGSSGGGNTSILRIMRLTKMMKLLRIFRILRMFRELRLILNSIIGSMRCMVWSVLLIVIITYVVAIVFLQSATAALMDGATQSTTDGLRKYWGTLSDSMFSLYIASTGGLDWDDVAQTLVPVGSAYYMVFLVYIAFFLFVVMNTLTSLFVETAFKNAEQDQQMVIQHELKKKNEYIGKIRKLFQKIAKDDREELFKADFDKVLHDSEMLAFMQSVDIDTVDVEQFFNILSCEGTQGVDIETFVVGCMKLRGMARSMDLLGVIHTQRQDSNRIKQIETQMLAFQDFMKSILTKDPAFLAAQRSQKISHERSRVAPGEIGRESPTGFPQTGAQAQDVTVF